MRDRFFSLAPHLVFASVLIRKLAILLYNISMGRPVYMIFFPDDFYYYAKIAGNIAKTGVSTFDGNTLTNGYHPLWMGVLTFVAKITGGVDDAFFIGVIAVCSLCLIASYIAMIKLGRALFENFTFVPWIALAIAIVMMPIIFSAMEVALAIPLMLTLAVLFCREGRKGFTKPACLGFMSSLLILARLDALLVVALGLVFWSALSEGTLSSKAKQIAVFCLGGVLLPLYLVSNLIFFGSLMTVSATAKQLGNGLFFNVRPLLQIFENGLAIKSALPLSLAAFALFSWKSNREMKLKSKVVFLSMAIFPFLFYGIFCLRSDWKIILWYYYPMFPALFVSVGLIAWRVEKRFTEKLMLVGKWAAIAGGLTIILALIGSTVGLIGRWDNKALREQGRKSVLNNPAYQFVMKLADFMNNHPGRYAMGDYAGAPSHLTTRSILQLEGLVADPKLVSYIRQESDLAKVLDEYEIDYLVVTDRWPLLKKDDCYRVFQPNPDPAGKRSKKMIGDFCFEPVLYFETGQKPDLKAAEFVTYVFHLTSTQTDAIDDLVHIQISD